MARIGELIGPNQEVIHPKTSASVVYLEDGRSVEQVLSNDIDYGNTVFQDNTYHFGNDVEDDFAKTMIIKGQTYQNILPEPSLRNSMSKGKTMQKFNEGYDNVNVVDGIAKSAILSGNTLVNLMTNCKDEYVVRYYAANNPDNNVANISMMKPNTEYTLFYKAKYRTEGDGAGTSGVLKIATSIEQGFISTAQSLTTEYKQYVYRFTTSSVVDCFVFSTTDKYFAIKECVLLEGNYTQDYIPYFEGMTSCKMPILSTVGKNLFNIKDNTHALTKLENGNYKSIPFKVLNLPKFKEKTSYTLSFSVSEFYDSTYQFPQITYTDGTKLVSYRANKTFNGNPAYILTSDSTKTISCIDFSYGTNDVILEFVHFQIEEGSVATSYEPYKTNILHTPEEVVLREVNGVRDTLNLMTGEYVQRIGEVVLDGTSVLALNKWEFGSDCTEFNFNAKGIKGDGVTLSNFAKSYLKSNRPRNIETVSSNNLDNTFVLITIQKSKLVTDSVEGMNQYLQSNPITIQYELKTPIVKTVDLSSSGNWEKVVLDGSEDESWGDGDNGLSKTHRFYVRIPNSLSGNHRPITDSTYFTAIEAGTSFQDTPCVQVASNNIYFRIERQIANDLTSFKTWLQSNPLTVWYPTATHQDSTQVKQPIFFKDGHIQLSSGADNSLIPTLDYQAKTSNSYVMDLMKTNTRYTMKAKSASGTFTIDGTSYGAGTNGTFTTPSSMTNKLLVMSNKTNEEVMIIEGDVVSKTIPYFKGIKSAFEDESKIEVLSVGKNLWDNKVFKDCPIATINDDGSVTLNGKLNYHWMFDYMIDKGTYYASAIGNDTGYIHLFWGGGDEFFHKSKPFTISEKVTRRGYVASGTYENAKVYLQLEQGMQATPYQPYKLNTTKIPLSSPLRSLPNGVRDEVILDRENNKVKVIQRVGHEMFDGSENWQRDSFNFANRNFLRFITFLTNVKTNGKGLCDKLPVLEGDAFGMNYIRPSIDRTWIYKADLTVTTDSLVRELSTDPLTLYYELATPIITEIDLDGYPYIYKDGHIFLNSEIAPTVGLEYSINQGHRIEGQVETLQRHEQQLTRFERYFADLVYSDYNFALYNFALLKFNETLYQEEGDA